MNSFSVFPRNDSDIVGIIHLFKFIPVVAYSSSVQNGNNVTYGAQNAIDHSSKYRWVSSNTPNQWIVLNFTDHEIYTTHYSVQSANFEE